MQELAGSAVDAVLVAIGATPDVGWLESSEVMVDGSVLCNEFRP